MSLDVRTSTGVLARINDCPPVIKIVKFVLVRLCPDSVTDLVILLATPVAAFSELAANFTPVVFDDVIK